MDANKSRYRKFRGRTYLEDLITFLSEDDWNTVVFVIRIYADDPDRCLRQLATTELHRIDVDCNFSGQANWRHNRIDIHTQLFQSDDEEEFYDTLFHEIAHLIAFFGCDHHGHGAKWRRIFADLGYPDGQTCHSLGRLRGTTGKPRTRRVYVYRCNSCGYETHRRKAFHDPSLWHHRNCTNRNSCYEYHREYRETL